MQQDLESLQIKPSRRKNEIERGIKSLERNKQIVIRGADKGGGLFILNKSDDLAELNRLVNDVETYEILRGNPTNKFKAKLIRLVKNAQAEDIVTKKEARYLVPDAPRVPAIYQLPKVHKNPSTPSGRPIVSGVDSLFARIGEYLDQFLQPLAQSCPAYLKDSRNLIELLQQVEVNEGYLLGSIDVNSLYTTIQQQYAIEAAVWALNSTKIKNKDFLVHALDLAMSTTSFGMISSILGK